MPALTANTLLGAWERTLSQSPTQRALTLLGVVCDEMSPEQLAALAIGQRDARLLSLRESAFGPQMTGLVKCPACSQDLEINFTVTDLRVAPPTNQSRQFVLTNVDLEVEFRLPNSADVAAITRDADHSANKRRLIEHCLSGVRRNGETVTPDRLPAELLAAVSERMAEADPQADAQLSVTCPTCTHPWRASLDIASYLWTEVNAWARRLLGEVHALASAYGWSEADILALSPWRRQAYLELIHR